MPRLLFYKPDTLLLTGFTNKVYSTGKTGRINRNDLYTFLTGHRNTTEKCTCIIVNAEDLHLFNSTVKGHVQVIAGQRIRIDGEN